MTRLSLVLARRQFAPRCRASTEPRCYARSRTPSNWQSRPAVRHARPWWPALASWGWRRRRTWPTGAIATTVVEMADQVLTPLDPEMAVLVAAELVGNGVIVYRSRGRPKSPTTALFWPTAAIVGEIVWPPSGAARRPLSRDGGAGPRPPRRHRRRRSGTGPATGCLRGGRRSGEGGLGLRRALADRAGQHRQPPRA